MFLNEVKFGQVVRRKNCYAVIKGYQEDNGDILLIMHDSSRWKPVDVEPLTNQERGVIPGMMAILPGTPEPNALDREV